MIARNDPVGAANYVWEAIITATITGQYKTITPEFNFQGRARLSFGSSTPPASAAPINLIARGYRTNTGGSYTLTLTGPGGLNYTSGLVAGIMPTITLRVEADNARIWGGCSSTRISYDALRIYLNGTLRMTVGPSNDPLGYDPRYNGFLLDPIGWGGILGLAETQFNPKITSPADSAFGITQDWGGIYRTFVDSSGEGPSLLQNQQCPTYSTYAGTQEVCDLTVKGTWTKNGTNMTQMSASFLPPLPYGTTCTTDYVLPYLESNYVITKYKTTFTDYGATNFQTRNCTCPPNPPGPPGGELCSSVDRVERFWEYRREFDVTKYGILMNSADGTMQSRPIYRSTRHKPIVDLAGGVSSITRVSDAGPVPRLDLYRFNHKASMWCLRDVLVNGICLFCNGMTRTPTDCTPMPNPSWCYAELIGHSQWDLPVCRDTDVVALTYRDNLVYEAATTSTGVDFAMYTADDDLVTSQPVSGVSGITSLALTVNYYGIISLYYIVGGNIYRKLSQGHGINGSWTAAELLRAGTMIAATIDRTLGIEYHASLEGTVWKLYRKLPQATTFSYVADILTGVSTTSAGALTMLESGEKTIVFVCSTGGVRIRRVSTNHGNTWVT